MNTSDPKKESETLATLEEHSGVHGEGVKGSAAQASQNSGDVDVRDGTPSPKPSTAMTDTVAQTRIDAGKPALSL